MNQKSIVFVAVLSAVFACFLTISADRLLSVRAQGGDPGVLQVKELRLVDSQDRLRGRWHLDAEGRVNLSFFDLQGNPRAVIGVLPDGHPGVALTNPQGKIQIGMAIFRDDTPRLTLHDGNGAIRASLGVGRNGHPELRMRDAGGSQRANLLVDDRGMPKLYLKDDKERNRIGVWLDQAGLPSLAFYDEQSRAAAQLGVSGLIPEASLRIFDSNGEIEVELPR